MMMVMVMVVMVMVMVMVVMVVVMVVVLGGFWGVLGGSGGVLGGSCFCFTPVVCAHWQIAFRVENLSFASLLRFA